MDARAPTPRGALFRPTRINESISDSSEAIRLNSQLVEGHSNRAINDFTALLKFNSTNTDAYVHLYGANWLKGDFREAIADCRIVVRLNPGASFYWRELSMMLSCCPGASVRGEQEAVEAARKACELSEWKDPLCLATLAEAFANSGDFEQAVRFQKQALAMTDWPASQRDEMRRRLALYQQGKPYREAILNSVPGPSANPTAGTAGLLTNPDN